MTPCECTQPATRRVYIGTRYFAGRVPIARYRRFCERCALAFLEEKREAQRA